MIHRRKKVGFACSLIIYGFSQATESNCKSWRNFRFRGQFEIKLLIVRLINTTYFLYIEKIELEQAIIWKLVTSQRITSKKLDFDGSIPEPAIRSRDNGQRIPCFDSCQLITTWLANNGLHLGSQTS